MESEEKDEETNGIIRQQTREKYESEEKEEINEIIIH